MPVGLQWNPLKTKLKLGNFKLHIEADQLPNINTLFTDRVHQGPWLRSEDPETSTPPSLFLLIS